MAQSATNTNTNATRNNVVVNPQSTTNATPKGGNATANRVVETRDMWAVVFDHTATLLAKVCNGEAVEQDDIADFAFGKATDKEGKTRRVSAKEQPNIRPYFHSLLAGFASKKGYKAAKGTQLGDLNLEEIAEKVFVGLHPKGDFAGKIGKAEPKQAKSIVNAVIAKL